MISVTAKREPCKGCPGGCKYVQCAICRQWSKPANWEIYDHDSDWRTVGICPHCDRVSLGGYDVPDANVICAQELAEAEAATKPRRKGSQRILANFGE